MNFIKNKMEKIVNLPIVAKIKQPTRPFPILDNIVAAYVAVVVLFQILFQISPVMSFFVNTPLYEMQTYLGLLGGGLIIADVFTTKRIWNSKYSLFLYIILAVAALSSVYMLSYGVKENLFKLCWSAIQFVLVYSLSLRLKHQELKTFVKTLFYVVLAIWGICCCISLHQYINQIGYTYVVDPLAKDSSTNRQGFYDNRLFGIFYTLNTAASLSSMLFLANIFFILKEKKMWLKIVLGIAEFVLLAHIVLSVSRSAILALLICAAVLPWFLMRNAIAFKAKDAQKVWVPIVAALVVMAISVGGFRAFKAGLTYLPHLNAKRQIALNEKEESATATSSETVTTTPDEKEDVTDESSTTTSAAPSQPTTSAPSQPTTSATTPPTAVPPEFNQNILDRENLEEDYSNGRFNIWGDYVSLYKDIGLFGLSPNYMPYVMENHPDLFIVEDIRVNYPDKYESGIIYHGHSGYLIVFIATGFVGALSMLAFIVLCVINVIKTISQKKTLSVLFIGSFLFALVGAVSAALDEGLFFQSSPQTTLFWFALGILMNRSLEMEEKASLDVQD